MSEHWRHLGENWHLFLVTAQAQRFNMSQLVGAVCIGLMGAMVGTYNTTRDLTLEVKHLTEKMVTVSAEIRTIQETNRQLAERNAERLTRLEVQVEAFAPNAARVAAIRKSHACFGFPVSATPAIAALPRTSCGSSTGTTAKPARPRAAISFTGQSSNGTSWLSIAHAAS